MHDLAKFRIQNELGTKLHSSVVTKIAIVGAVVMMLSAFSAPAEAGSHYRGHQGYGGHYNRHSYRHSYGHGYRRSHRSHHSNRGAYLVGGLVLGGIIASAIHRNHDPYVVRESRVEQSSRADRRVTRRLYRDRDGNCFERTFSSNGDELLSELDPADCAW
jgi:hypothetical protein